jgi:sigma-B regulation protein RsbU (phosphoserine phosphatase)
LLLAALFAIATALYSGIWTYYIRILPQSVVGVAFRSFSPDLKQFYLVRVSSHGPAERAGLLPGDRIVAINGRPLDTTAPWVDSVLRGKPGSKVALTVERAPADRLQLELTIPNVPPDLINPSRIKSLILESLLSYPFFFLIVGMVVLFLRPDDRNAWLLALMFAGFISLASWLTPEAEPLVPIGIRRFALSYQYAFRALLPGLFYYFFAVFPVPSPLDRKLPSLKFVLLGIGALLALPMASIVSLTGSSAGVIEFNEAIRRPSIPNPLFIYGFCSIVLGLVSLIWSAVSAPTAEARRKIRVLVVGTVVGVAPMQVLSLFMLWSGKEGNPLHLPFWVWVAAVAGLILLPLSFAYAVVKHRVMELPVLLKRSARYLLVKRGFAIFITVASAAAAWAAVEFFSGVLEGWGATGPRIALPAGLAAAGVGGLLVVASSRIQQRVRRHLDRAFFRSDYDARQILEDLAQSIRMASSSPELAELLDKQIRQALHPLSLTIYVEFVDGQLKAEGVGLPTQLRVLSTGLPAFEELQRRGRPFDAPLPGSDSFPLFSMFDALSPECMVPMPARDGRLVGVIVLGPRLSEEPYGSDDKRLLSSVANQAGLAIDSIRMAERMALRLEAERREAHESEMAREVQARLLPQHAPQMKTLDYAGRCVQARAVGGDYYDFLDIGESRIALVLADVSGKGMSAALLMASLQAALRTHCSAGLWDPGAIMRQVNRLLYESTAPQHFATLFLAEYDDTRQRLRFVNCGHNPPLLLRSAGALQRLDATATVLGVFPDWNCTVGEIALGAGDLLAMFTDGITEAANDHAEDFGEDRLIAALQAHRNEPVAEILDAVIRAVQEFGGKDQSDDLTLIVARVHPELGQPDPSLPQL